MTPRCLRTLLIFSTVLLSLSAHAAEEQNNLITWAGCGITKKAFMKELAEAYTKKTGIEVKLSGGGATRGIRDTVKGKVMIGGSCRMSLPGADKSELYANLHPVAWDALAIIVHPTNPVNNLTMKQVRAIYTGKITNWKQVGGPDAPIHLYVRRGKISGVGYAIRQYVFQDSNMDFVTDRKYVVRSSGPLEKAAEKDPYAMGITGVSSARKRKVKIIAFDGKTPTYEHVASGQYGLYRPLYLVTSPHPTREVKDFIAFATSDEGRRIIRENGTVPYKDAPKLMSKMLIYGFDVK
ncbi:MAG TPA: phosphate ABC transporter substrate-binding protein [Gammaproteobacteria bacterium]|nr:phosphate ABC transporter substrate-binding protein [Gammaproteobacteria bacterium]